MKYFTRIKETKTEIKDFRNGGVINVCILCDSSIYAVVPALFKLPK